MDGAIRKAQERMDFVSRDMEALRECHMREMALSDWNSAVNYARSEGRQEGWTEGRQEILALLKSGKLLEEIIRDYGE